MTNDDVVDRNRTGLSARGPWLLAWTVSLAMVVGTLADKIAEILAADDDFRVSEDLGVYQDAAVAMVHGLTLYSAETFRIGQVNYIYPPFAGLLMAPMAYIDTWALVVLHHLVLLASLAVMLWSATRAEGLDRPLWWTAALVGPATVLYVINSNTSFGQINLVLMALVFADVFGVIPARFRGVGVGLAAAVKLTPIGFVLIFLVRRDWWSAVRALATVAVTVVVGFVALPSDSARYWSEIAWDPERGGLRFQVNNQSVTGPLLRAGMSTETLALVHPVVALVVVAAVAWTAWVFHQRGWDTACVGIVGLGIVYAAPMSVQHHWVVVVLAPVMLLSARYTPVAPWLMSVAALMVANPVVWFSYRNWPISRDLPWPGIALQAVVSVGALVLIVASTVSATRWRRSHRQGSSGGTAEPDPETKQMLGKVGP